MTTNNHPWRGDQGRIPLVTAAAIVAVLLAQSIVMMLVNFLSFGFSAQWLESIGYGLPLEYLPVGVGVFASLRYVAPIRAGSAMSRIVLRSLVALALGAVLCFFVALIWSFAQLPQQPSSDTHFLT